MNNHNSLDVFKWMDSHFSFIALLLRRKELKSYSVIGSPAFRCNTFTQLTYWRIVMLIKWHICSEFSLKCFSGEKDLAAGRMFVITVISVVLLEELAASLSITSVRVCACVCMCVRVCRMFSHSYQHVLGHACAAASYQCNSPSFMCLVKKCKEFLEIKVKETQTS